MMFVDALLRAKPRDILGHLIYICAKTVYTAVKPFFYPYRTVQFFKKDFTVRVMGKFI